MVIRHVSVPVWDGGSRCVVLNGLQPLPVLKPPPVLLAASQQPAHEGLHGFDFGRAAQPLSQLATGDCHGQLIAPLFL